MILHYLLIFEYLLADLAPVLLDSDFIILTPGYGLLFFEPVPLSYIFPVFPQLLLLLLPFPRPIFFLLPQLFRLLSILLHLEFLVPRVPLLDVVQELLHCIIELLLLHLSLLLVFCLDETLDSTIRCSIRVVLVCIREILKGREEFPLAVEFEDVVRIRVGISEIRQKVMLFSYILFHFLLLVKSAEQIGIDSVEVIILL
jgi:hypothetical protein